MSQQFARCGFRTSAFCSGHVRFSFKGPCMQIDRRLGDSRPRIDLPYPVSKTGKHNRLKLSQLYGSTTVVMAIYGLH